MVQISIALCRSYLCGISGVISRVRARGIFLRRSLSKVVDVLTACASVPRRETEAQAVKTSTTLDSDSVRKIPREKFRTFETPYVRRGRAEQRSGHSASGW